VIRVSLVCFEKKKSKIELLVDPKIHWIPKIRNFNNYVTLLKKGITLVNMITPRIFRLQEIWGLNRFFINTKFLS